MTSQISRRSLAKGAAWAAPVVAASAAVPAYAASQRCQAEGNIGADTFFWYGEAYYDTGLRRWMSQPDTMTSEFNEANLTINGLDPDETIVSQTFTIAVEEMPINANRRTLPTGALDITQANRVTRGQLATGWTLANVSSPSQQSITVNGQTVQSNMWSITFSNTRGTGGRYTDSGDGCRTYQSGNFILSPFVYFRDNVESLALPPEPDAIPNQAFLVTVTTSKGRTIELKGMIWSQGSIIQQESTVR